jgi:arabinan endo-1,5-alpha-L-arabinosidase
VTPLSIELTADGQVTGAYSGTWSNEEGTCYLTIKLGTVTYNGVIFEEQIDGKTIKTVSFSAMATSGVNVWGYKYRPDYSLAWQLNNAPITSPTYTYNQNYDLYNQNLVDNVKLKWTSDNPLVISDYGQYYPLGLTANATVKLTARLTAGNYFWEKTSSVSAKSEENSKPTATINWDGEMVAHYKFDTAELPNALNTNEKAELKQNGTTALPVLEQDADSLRNGKVVRLNFGAANYESYVVIPNPLKGVDLTTTGATFSFYVKRYDDNLWDALFGVQSGTARFFVTPNLYVGYNDGVTPDEGSGVYNNWIDLNQPNTLITNAIGLDRWHMVTISVSPSQYTGFSIFIDGTKLASTKEKYNGKLNGTTFTAKQGFDYKLILNMLSTADEICLGKGSFWGSPNVAFDDFIVHSRCLTTANEAAALRQMINRSDINQTTTGISEMPVLSEEQNDQNDSEAIYDLSGRKVTTLKPGLYIKNGKKFVVR